MSIPTDKFESGKHKYQQEVLEAFDSGQCRYILLEWARRHRKTTLMLNLLLRETFRWPNSSYGLILPLQTEARSVVWDDPNMLMRYLPDKKEFGWKLNDQKMLMKAANGSILKVGGADDPDSWRGIDFVGVGFDEAKWIKEEMWTRIINPVMMGPLIDEKIRAGMKRWAMFTYTPNGPSWITDMFDYVCMLGEGGELPDCGVSKKLRPGYFASRLDAEKAGIIPMEVLLAEKAKTLRAVYDEEMRCARLTEEMRTLITSLMLSELKDADNEILKIMPIRRIVSIDPAFGGDSCSVRAMENTVTKELKALLPSKTEQIVFEAKCMAQRLGTKNFIVDCIGNGKGVADALDSDVAGYKVQYFNSAEKPVNDRSLYINKRAEAYAYTGDQIRTGQVPQITERELLRQLPIASRYKVVHGKCQIIAKDEIKKVLKCSPDDADSYVMGIWGLQNVEPIGRAVVSNYHPQQSYDFDPLIVGAL